MTSTSSYMQDKTTGSGRFDPIGSREAACAVASPLSFSRAAISALFSRSCRLVKLRLDLDMHGRGEVLYRFDIDSYVFHFFVISQELAEAQKLDRNFAASWDAMGVFCQGDWTIGRESYLREQIPLQRAGRADYDTLIYARGNRSGRLFSSVVEALGDGRQPDPARLAQVGYIMRTTAFIGNGQLGTRQFAGFGDDHPLRAPYHAQMVAGFLLREFNFDLVDAMAAQRSTKAVRLAPPIRRFLGLGNSAATGLVPFLATHSRLIADWVTAEREALAKLYRRIPTLKELSKFKQLLARAIAHLDESARPDDGVFLPDDQLSRALTTVLAALPERGISWGELREYVFSLAHEEAAQLSSALMLEVASGDIGESARTNHVDERHRIAPGVSTKALLVTLRAHYGWALAAARKKDADHFFWYRAASAPRDLRRGVRGRVPQVEFETPMDWVLRLAGLVEALDSSADMPLADFLAAHPQFRAVAARTQAELINQAGELAVNLCSADYAPFATIRQVLAIFGLDKFEAALPKSVRGTFLQGAPIAEDLDADGSGKATWPFPLVPSEQEVANSTPLPPYRSTSYAAPAGRHEASARTEDVVISLIELERNLARTLQAGGMSLGLANDAARLAALAVAAQPEDLNALITELVTLKTPLNECPVLRPGEVEAFVRLDARHIHPLAVLPVAHDIAFDRAERHGASLVLIESVGESAITDTLSEALAFDVRACSIVPGTMGSGGGLPLEVWADLSSRLGMPVNSSTAGSSSNAFAIMCLGPCARSALSEAALATCSERHRNLCALEQRALQEGVRVERKALVCLEQAAARLFISAEVEQKLRDEVIDPLRMF